MSSTLGKLLEGALTNEMGKRVQQPILPDRQHVWRIITKDRQSAVILTRSLRNDTIWVTVRFNISSEGAEDSDDDDDGDGGEGDYDGEDGEDEDGEGDGVDIIDCSISITKNYNSLLLNCSASSYGGFEPYRVRFIEESSLVQVLLHEPTAESEEQIKARDIGPDYSELSPQIQLEFKRYLERFEINQALANFIISFAEYKKHEETKRWYESVKNFVDHY